MRANFLSSQTMSVKFGREGAALLVRCRMHARDRRIVVPVFRARRICDAGSPGDGPRPTSDETRRASKDMLNRHLSVYFGANVMSALVGFLSITVFTRLLSPQEYGVYVVGMSISWIAGAILFTWIRLSVSRYQPASTETDYRGIAIAAYALTAAVLACIVPVAMMLRGTDADHSALFASLFIALTMGAFDISQEFSRAYMKSGRYAAAVISRSVLAFVLGWSVIMMGWGGLGLLGSVGISFLLGTLVTFGGIQDRPASCQYPDLAKFVRYGLPLSLGGLSVALYTVSDRLVVAYLLGEGAAGEFGVAAELPRQFTAMLAASITAATFPVIFRTYATESLAETRLRLNETAEMILAVIVPVTVWLALASDQIAGTLVGAGFRDSVTHLLPVLAVARLLGIANQFYLQISFQLSERSLLSVIQSTITLAVSVVLMAALVTGYGLTGAAYAALLTEAVSLGVGLLLMSRAFPLPLDLRRLAKVAVCTAAMGGAIYSAKNAVSDTGPFGLLVVIAVGGIVYAAAAVAIDLANIRTTMTRFCAFAR
jgi:O-antigen/teichoic acid export membrane protein